MHCFLLQPAKRQSSQMLLLPASRNKGGCAEPVLKGGRERASAEGLCFGQTTLCRTPSPTAAADIVSPPRSPKGRFLPSGTTKSIVFIKGVHFARCFP